MTLRPRKSEAITTSTAKPVGTANACRQARPGYGERMWQWYQDFKNTVMRKGDMALTGTPSSNSPCDFPLKIMGKASPTNWRRRPRPRHPPRAGLRWRHHGNARQFRRQLCQPDLHGDVATSKTAARRAVHGTDLAPWRRSSSA